MRAILLRVFLLLAIFLALPTQFAAAYEERYLPLASNVLAKRFRQKLVLDPLERGNSISFERTRISISDSGLLNCHGTDNTGKTWSLVANSWNGCASIWSADLDNNGMTDLIIAMRIESEGYTPGAQVIFLMFEKNGRAMPWALDGFFDIDEYGLKDLLDADNNGHAELIQQRIDDGYWITSFYETHNAKWRKLDAFNGNSAPLYTRYTELENRTAVKPPASRHPIDQNYSNESISCKSAPGLTASSINWRKKTNDPLVYLSDNRRIRLNTCSPSACIILDDEAGRRAALFSARDAANNLISEIASRRMPLKLWEERQKLRTPDITVANIVAKGTHRGVNNSNSALDIALLKCTELP